MIVNYWCIFAFGGLARVSRMKACAYPSALRSAGATRRQHAVLCPSPSGSGMLTGASRRRLPAKCSPQAGQAGGMEKQKMLLRHLCRTQITPGFSMDRGRQGRLVVVFVGPECHVTTGLSGCMERMVDRQLFSLTLVCRPE